MALPGIREKRGRPRRRAVRIASELKVINQGTSIANCQSLVCVVLLLSEDYMEDIHMYDACIMYVCICSSGLVRV